MSGVDENRPLMGSQRRSYAAVENGDSAETSSTTSQPEEGRSWYLSVLILIKVKLGLATSSSSRRPTEGTSWYLSVFLVVNAALGSAFLNFPRAFDEAGGVGAALGVQSVLLLIASLTLIILAYCSDASKATTYQDVILGVMGSRVGTICSITIVVYCFGTCITFLIIIGDQWDRFFFSYTGDPLFCHTFYFHRRFTIVVSSLLFILPLCYPKRIDFLKYAAAAGVFANVYLDFLQVYKYYTGEYADKAGPIKTGPDHWTDLFLVAPTIFFGYQCHVSSIPIYACLEKRTIGEFLKTVLTAMAVCALTYSVAATYGYWTFGSNVDPDILSNYDANDPLVLAGLIAMAFKTYTTYPLIIFCGRTGVDSLLRQAMMRRRGGDGGGVNGDNNNNNDDGGEISDQVWEQGEKKRRIIQVSVWFFVTIAISMIVPGIDFMIPVLGAFAAGFIVIFPGICLLEVALRRKEKKTTEIEERKDHSLQRSRDIQETGEAVVDIEQPRKDPIGSLLLATASFLLIFGSFMLGIIVTNSVMNLNAKKPLCS